MSNEDLLLSQTANSSILAKQCDSAAAVRKGENKSDLKEVKNASEDGERTGKKRDSLIRKKNMDRLNRIHLRRSGGSSDKSPSKLSKQEATQARCSASANQSQEDIANAPKAKNAKKSPEEVVSTSRFKRKSKEVEKSSPDSKTSPPVEKPKKSGSKIKAVTAFGTTFHKEESEQLPPLPKKRASSSTTRFRKSKRTKSKDAITEEAGVEVTNESSQSQLRPSTRNSSLKMSLSKNKLTDMLEDKDMEKGKMKGAFESTTGKRARSPYHASSKVEDKKQTSKVRMEGDTKHTTNVKPEEKSELGKDLSFFEKIQQNVRAYFSPKASELGKFEEEEKKKVQDGEHPVNVMIWKDERIERGFKEESVKGDKDFFVYSANEKEIDLETGCKTIANEYFPGQKSAKGYGSGPGGKVAYSNGDMHIPSTDYQCKRLYYIKRRNCTEKPRTGSFHRSKTFQKNGLAPSAPKSSSSIRLILEPDEQVENFSSANGVASALIQIQELHQEINQNFVPRRVSYARGTVKEENTSTVNRLACEITSEWVKGSRRAGRRTCRITSLMRSRLKRAAAVAKPKSTSCLRRCESATWKRTKSEGSIQSCSFIHSLVHLKDFPRLTLSSEKVKSPPKQDLSFVPMRRKWFVYSVTDSKSIQTPRQGLPSGGLRSTEETVIRSEYQKTGSPPVKCPETAKKVQEEPPSVTLKDMIHLVRTVFNQSSEKVSENRECGLAPRKDTENSFPMSQCLEKLMQEKKNYLNLEKTKKLRKAQKANFVSDSFNFFNLLNKEFLSLKSSNPRIEELRDVIAQKKEPEMEEYLDMYKRVIRMSLTEPQQYLMDKAKQELERYTDLYYDLMKCICLEKEGKDGATLPTEKSCGKLRDKVNYEELLDSRANESVKTWESYSERAKPRIEKPHLGKMQDRTNRNSDIGRSSFRTNNLKKNVGVVSAHAKDHNMNDSKAKPVVELLSPQKNKEPHQDSEGKKSSGKEKEDPSSSGKILVALSLCDGGLLIKHAEDGSKGVADGENKGQTSLPPEDDKESSGTFSQSGQVKAHSPLSAVYRKSSTSEDDIEQSLLKFRAFQKILREGVHHFAPYAEDEDEQRQRWKGEQESKCTHENFKTSSNDRKRDLDHAKLSKKHKPGADSLVYTIREDNVKEPFHKKRSNSFSRSVSPNEKEDGIKKVPWWRKDNFPTSSSGVRMQRSNQGRKTENYKSPKRVLPKAKKETGSKVDKKKKKMKTEAKNEGEEDLLKTDSEFATPPETFFEWRFGVKDLEELLKEIASNMPSTDDVSQMKPVCPHEDKEDTEEQKLNLTEGDENNDAILEKEQLCNGHKTSLKLGFNNPLTAEWVEESSSVDYQKITEVLNQFLGSVAEVWKVAACLRNLIQPGTPKEEEAQPPQTHEKKEDTEEQDVNNRKTIESFKNFLRILTTIFEEDPREEVVGKELSLLKKEFIQLSRDEDSVGQSETGERTRFVQEVSEFPRGLTEMIASELLSDEKESVEPAFFLAALKKVGEKLKDSYTWGEGEEENEGEQSEYSQQQKIFYRPLKKSSQEDKEESAAKSNMGSLAEKIRKLCKEKNSAQESANEKCALKNVSLDTRSSVYFDATDTVVHFGDHPRSTEFNDVDDAEKVTLTPVDEGYFSLNGNNFEKYRNLIYDKIITFLRSDNPRNVNYGIALLGRMIDRDGSSLVKTERKASGTKEEREKKWQDLLDKLMEMCQAIDMEVKMEVEKCVGLEHEGNENKMEIRRTCEYLKGYVDRMKSLIKDMKSLDGQLHPNDPVQGVKALDTSRETNKERQLVSPDTKFPSKQKYLLDSAMDFINSIGNMGYSLDKFPFFPKCFGHSASEKRVSPEIDTYRNEVSNDLLLEDNKTMVKSLRKSIEKRQRKIQGMIEEAGKGTTQGESLLGEKITRKVRDLKKYYLILEKMICDPTLLPPKWLKLEGLDEKSGRNGNLTKKEESSVMTMLEDLMKQASVEHKTLKYSKSAISADSQNTGSPASVGSLTLVKIKYETLNVECPGQPKETKVTRDVEEEIENGVPLRPLTA